MNGTQVAITGLGPVSSIGIGKDAFFSGLKEGRSGTVDVTAFDCSSYRARKAALVQNFDVNEYLETAKAYMDRASELGFAGMSLAMEDANLAPDALAKDTALILGTAFGNLGTTGIFFDDFIKKGPRLVKPILFPHTYSNTTISLLAIEYGLSGYHMNYSSGNTSSALALVQGYDLIRKGRASRAIVGGFEAFSELLFAGFDRAGLLEAHNASSRGPFDLDAGGFVIGEGCGILVLEALETAEKRGATIYGIIAGAASLSDSSVGLKNGGHGLAAAMKLALQDASFEPESVDLVSANANGTTLADANEARAIAELMAKNSVTAPKSLIGETLGAAAALQTIAAMGSFADQFASATHGTSAGDDQIGIQLIRSPGQSKRIERILLNSVDPGGSIVSIALRGPE